MAEIGNWIPERIEASYYGGPSLKVTESQSLMVNHHVNEKSDKEVSSNYKATALGSDGFPNHLNGEIQKSVSPDTVDRINAQKSERITNMAAAKSCTRHHARIWLSKNKINKLRRYGIIPAELKRYTINGILPDEIMQQYL